MKTIVYGLPGIFSAIGWICFVSPSLAEDWPHWRGPVRTGRTSESSGWENGRWPVKAPLWQSNVGTGAAAPVFAEGRIYTVGWSEGRDTLSCLEPATGKMLWKQSFPAPEYGRHAVGDKSMYRGSTATPEYDPTSGLIFTLGCDGDLHAWDTRQSGKEVWSLNLYDRFGIPRRPQITQRKNTLRDYGFTTAPLVTGDWVIVEVGDPQRGCLMAFDKRNGGDPVWCSENRDPAGHSGGMARMEVEGIPCVAVATSWNALVVRIDGANAGKTVAAYEWKTDFSNTIAGISAEGQDLLIASRYNQMAMARITVTLKDGARELWRNRYPTGVCTPVIHDGLVYFANHGVHCIDFTTGRLVWEGGKVGDAGSCLFTGDGRLVVWANDGDLSLIEGGRRSPQRCLVLAESPRLLNDMAWPHVVLANGRLLCKTLNGDLICFGMTP